MRTVTKTRRMPGITTIRPQAVVSKLIDTCIVQPRCTMDRTTAIQQMASDMREASYREGGMTEHGLELLGYTDKQITELVIPARQLADRLAAVA